MGSLGYDFRGDVALVTGAASGIGLAIVRALAQAGARVRGFDLAEPGAAIVGEPWASGLTWHAVDVRSAADVDAAVAVVLAAEGHIDHLVNCAGIARDRALWNLDEASWSAVLDVNLTGAFHLLRAVAPAMRARRAGRIVQIASVNGLRGKFGQANYCASKAGLIALTRTAARELGSRGITVNAIAPGMIETPMSASLPPEVREQARAETCLGHLGLPEDVARAALFLLSDAAAHVTGAVLAVDGGQLA
jgi:acetoacetyl-CoA reductase/3-oxoacyl-[acyl-carrier protein] reductase